MPELRGDDLGHRVDDDAELDAVEVGQLFAGGVAAPVVVVPDEDELVATRPAVELEGTAADRVAGEVLALLLDRRRGSHHPHLVGEARHQDRGRLLEDQAHRLVVDDFGAVEIAKEGAVTRADLGIDHAVEIVGDRGRIERRAVMEGHPLADGEVHGQAVVGDRPVGRELGLVLAFLVLVEERLVDQPESPDVGAGGVAEPGVHGRGFDICRLDQDAAANRRAPVIGVSSAGERAKAQHYGGERRRTELSHAFPPVTRLRWPAERSSAGAGVTYGTAHWAVCLFGIGPNPELKPILPACQERLYVVSKWGNGRPCARPSRPDNTDRRGRRGKRGVDGTKGAGAGGTIGGSPHRTIPASPVDADPRAQSAHAGPNVLLSLDWLRRQDSNLRPID